MPAIATPESTVRPVPFARTPSVVACVSETTERIVTRPSANATSLMRLTASPAAVCGPVSVAVLVDRALPKPSADACVSPTSASAETLSSWAVEVSFVPGTLSFVTVGEPDVVRASARTG
jgi:hypothetical protein